MSNGRNDRRFYDEAEARSGFQTFSERHNGFRITLGVMVFFINFLPSLWLLGGCYRWPIFILCYVSLMQRQECVGDTKILLRRKWVLTNWILWVTNMGSRDWISHDSKLNDTTRNTCRCMFMFETEGMFDEVMIQCSLFLQNLSWLVFTIQFN